MHRNGTTKVNLMKSVCLLAIRRNVLGALCPSMQAIKLINLLVLWSEIVTYDNVGSYMYVWYRLSICPLFPRCGNRSNWKSIRIDLNWKWICTGTGTSPGLRCTQCQDLTSSMNNHFSSMVLSTYVSSKDLAWTPSISATSSWLTMHPIIINTCEKELGTHMSTTNWPTLLVYATNDMDNRPHVQVLLSGCACKTRIPLFLCFSVTSVRNNLPMALAHSRTFVVSLLAIPPWLSYQPPLASLTFPLLSFYSTYFS